MTKNVLITGVGSGLGLALVPVFAKNSWHVLALCHKAGDIKKFLRTRI